MYQEAIDNKEEFLKALHNVTKKRLKKILKDCYIYKITCGGKEHE